MQLSQQQIKSMDKYDIKAITINDRNNEIPPLFYEYLTNVTPKFRDKLLQNYFTLNINNTDPYLISREVGNNFVSLIKADLLGGSSAHVIELNPGFGILTECLLQAGVPFINLYEKYDEFHSTLNSLSNAYPGRLNIKKANLLAMSKMLNINIKEKPDTNICELLGDIPKRKWEDENCMQVIGATTKHLFIRHLIISIVFQSGFMMYGRPAFYLALSPSVWNTFMYNGKKASTSCIMFNTLLNYKIYGTIDRRGFIPWLRKKKTANNNNERKTDTEMLHVVKLEPKPDLLKLFGGKDSIIYFWHFVRHHFYKPSLRVIPALEKIIPNCGVRLIEQNYNIFTEFGHLNPSQALDLFIQFKSWPEFKESSFLLSANEIKKAYDPYMVDYE